MLYSDSTNYGRATTATVFRQLTLNRAPLAGRGLEVVIRNVAIGTGVNARSPLYAGSTDDWLDLDPMTNEQLTATVDGAAAYGGERGCL